MTLICVEWAGITEAVNGVDSGDGVAILTDLFGGTPSNLAISCMSCPNVDVLAGINLPMLVKLAKVRQERSSAGGYGHGLQEAGRKYVTIASSVLAGQMNAEVRSKEVSDLIERRCGTASCRRKRWSPVANRPNWVNTSKISVGALLDAGSLRAGAGPPGSAARHHAGLSAGGIASTAGCSATA